MADDTYTALKYFISSLFPNLDNNEVYLAGEGYTGVFLPYVANLIMTENIINLKGMIMGNPFTNNDNDGIHSTLSMLANHAVISP